MATISCLTIFQVLLCWIIVSQIGATSFAWGTPKSIPTLFVSQQHQHQNQNVNPLTVRGGGTDANNEAPPNNNDTGANFLGPVVRVPETFFGTPGTKRGLIFMDSFCPYFGIYMANQARDAYGVCTINVLSNYMKNYFAKENPEDIQQWMPASIPVDMAAWKGRLPCDELVAVHCESDSGLADAEQLSLTAGVIHYNMPDEARRNKYLMNNVVSAAGIPTVKQKLCQTLNETLEFATELLESASNTKIKSDGYSDAGILGQGSNTPPTEAKAYCIVKPTRGVASENVHLCHDKESVEIAFKEIVSSTVFGDAYQKHQSVLVQEFAAGTEYAIDIVSKNGEHKVAALWRYDKRPTNGAPFCYFATELIDATQSDIGRSVCEYAKSCLTALGQKWGLTHNEVIVTSEGPRLVEVNCRQHNMDFAPITQACTGYNAFDMLLAAYLGGQPAESYPPGTEHLRLDWDTLPVLPSLRLCGAMVHLVNYSSGKLTSTQYLDEIFNMESTLELEVYPEFLDIGNEISKTVDIRSDAGWCQIINDNPEALRRDYNRIVELMPHLFTTE